MGVASVHCCSPNPQRIVNLRGRETTRGKGEKVEVFCDLRDKEREVYGIGKLVSFGVAAHGLWKMSKKL